jgi:type IV pilus assembly protein PilA
MLDKLNEIRSQKEAEDRGFTLIELLVVVVIIGILIAIAIPLYLNYQKGAKDKSAQSDLRAAVSTLQQCYTDNSNAYPTAAKVAGQTGETVADMTKTVTFTCGTDTETANLSSGTHMSYAIDATTGVVTLTTWNDGGKHNNSGSGYTYKTDAGGSIG